MKPAELEITAGLENAVFLDVGDRVKDSKGTSGEVLGFSADGNPVVLFDDDQEKVIDLTTESLTRTGSVGFRPWNVKKRARKETRVPFSKAKEMGFVHVAFDRYMFKPEATKSVAKYPWDNGSIWKVVSDKDNKKYLVKEEEEMGNDNKPPHQLDTDGQEPGNSKDTFNIFD